MASVRTCLLQHKNANCIKERIPEAQKQALQLVRQKLILSTVSYFY